MKWVILIYLAMWTNTPEVIKYTRLEFPASNFQECIDIAQQINDITNAHKSDVPYVRSFYWVYNNMLDEIKAECAYTDPAAPVPEWYKYYWSHPEWFKEYTRKQWKEDKKRDWRIPPDHPMIPPE